MTGKTVFDLLFSTSTGDQKKALNQLDVLVAEINRKNPPLKKAEMKKLIQEIDLPALVTFSLARPFPAFTKEVYDRMHEMVRSGQYISDHKEEENYLYQLPDMCENVLSRIRKLPKPPGKITYRLDQEYIRYVCENGERKHIDKLIEMTLSIEDGSLRWKGTRLRALPDELLNFKQIKSMEFHTAFLKEFPPVLLKTDQLEQLAIYSSKISCLPKKINALTKLKSLNLSRNIIESLPEEIGDLKELEVLNLSKNRLTELPISMARLEKLKTIHLESNPVTSAVQIQRLFRLFVEQSIQYERREVYLHLIFARIENVVALNNMLAVVSALNISLSLLQDNAMLALEQMCRSDLKNNPLKKGSVIRAYGKVEEIDVLEDELQDHEISLTRNVGSHCTHILIGVLPGKNPDLSVPVITPLMLGRFLKEGDTEIFLDREEDLADAKKKLNELLLSNDSGHQVLAFEMIKSLGMSENIVANVYFVYRTTRNKDVRNTAKQLLLQSVSRAFLQIINKNQSFNNASEPGFNRYLNELCDIDDINVLYFSRLVFDKTGMGINFIFENGSSEDISYVMDRIIARNGYLNLRYSHIKRLPDEVGEFTALTKIDLCANEIKCLPESIGKLKCLNVLILYDNKISKLPKSFSKLEGLEHLYLDSNKLKLFPAEIMELNKLKTLRIEYNYIKNIPSEVSNMALLKELGYGSNYLKKIPEEITCLKSLTKLAVISGGLESIPDEIKNLINLKELDLTSCYMTEFPLSICKLKNLENLDLKNNKIKNIPDKIESLINLTSLNMASNGLVELPRSITRIKSLQILNISYNKIEVFPEELSALGNLKHVCTGHYRFGSEDIILRLKALVPEGCVVE